MIPQQTGGQNGESRRQFIRKTGTVVAAVTGAGLFNLPVMASENNSPISLVLDAESPVTQELPVRWATEQLGDALAARGVSVQFYDRLDQAPLSQECIFVTGASSSLARQICEVRGIGTPDVAESFALARGKAGKLHRTIGCCSERAGMVYALLELSDRVQFATDAIDRNTDYASRMRAACQCRFAAWRACSPAMWRTKAGISDRAFWSRYLTMLATQRFNRFHLMLGIGYDFTTNITDCYFHFTYPFLLAVPGYNVRAVPLPDAERDANLEQAPIHQRRSGAARFSFPAWACGHTLTYGPTVPRPIISLRG